MAQQHGHHCSTTHSQASDQNMSSSGSPNQRQCSIAIVFLLALSASQALCQEVPEPSMSERHDQWMAKYGKVYRDDTRKQRRLQIFKNNVEFIEAFNAAGNKHYWLSAKLFADQTVEEFKAARNGYKRPLGPRRQAPFKYKNVTDVPVSMDWRKKGAVTPRKDQVQCGGVDRGCEGGEMENAFEFILHNHGLTSEANYPYTAADGTCSTAKEASHVAKITGYECIPANSEEALLKSVANQPVSVSADAGDGELMFYSGGVFKGQSSITESWQWDAVQLQMEQSIGW